MWKLRSHGSHACKVHLGLIYRKTVPTMNRKSLLIEVSKASKLELSRLLRTNTWSETPYIKLSQNCSCWAIEQRKAQLQGSYSLVLGVDFLYYGFFPRSRARFAYDKPVPRARTKSTQSFFGMTISVYPCVAACALSKSELLLFVLTVLCLWDHMLSRMKEDNQRDMR